MNKTFSKQQIAQIAIKVREFKKLYVTTEGQMFTNEPDAEEAVRVKNMIIDEPDSFVGIATITEDTVTDNKLKTFAKNTEEFGKLFDGAKIPKMKETKGNKHERKREASKADDEKIVEGIAAALGLHDEEDEEDETEKKQSFNPFRKQN